MTKKELAAEVAELRREVAMLRGELAAKSPIVIQQPPYPQPTPWRNPYVYPYVTTSGAQSILPRDSTVTQINARSAS